MVKNTWQLKLSDTRKLEDIAERLTANAQLAQITMETLEKQRAKIMKDNQRIWQDIKNKYEITAPPENLRVDFYTGLVRPK